MYNINKITYRGNFGEVFDLVKSVKIAKLLDYCMRAYGAKNSDRQIKNSPIPIY